MKSIDWLSWVWFHGFVDQSYLELFSSLFLTPKQNTEMNYNKEPDFEEESKLWNMRAQNWRGKMRECEYAEKWRYPLISISSCNVRRGIWHLVYIWTILRFFCRLVLAFLGWAWSYLVKWCSLWSLFFQVSLVSRTYGTYSMRLLFKSKNGKCHCAEAFRS